jgi:superfamily II DNA/RNA helicase
MREPVEKLIAPGADDKPTVEKVEQYYLSVGRGTNTACCGCCCRREPRPGDRLLPHQARRGKAGQKLHADGIECREIHGNLAQNKRERVMKSFRGGKFDVLVATDLASRGIDVADISHIINYDIPEDPEVYVHRVGRTARMGAKGKAFTFVTPRAGRRADQGRSADQHGDPPGHGRREDPGCKHRWAFRSTQVSNPGACEDLLHEMSK